jgi:hypothetical protein
MILYYDIIQIVIKFNNNIVTHIFSNIQNELKFVRYDKKIKRRKKACFKRKYII